jgi:hypothetical protein
MQISIERIGNNVVLVLDVILIFFWRCLSLTLNETPTKIAVSLLFCGKFFIALMWAIVKLMTEILWFLDLT